MKKLIIISIILAFSSCGRSGALYIPKEDDAVKHEGKIDKKVEIENGKPARNQSASLFQLGIG